MMASIWAPAWIRAFIATARNAQYPDHLHVRVPGLRDAAGAAGLDSAGGGLGAGRIRFAVASAARAIGPVDFNDDQAVIGQEPQQSGAEASRG